MYTTQIKSPQKLSGSQLKFDNAGISSIIIVSQLLSTLIKSFFENQSVLKIK